MSGTRTFTKWVGVALVACLTACGSAPVAPGFYRVERGDTLSKIAREHRQSVQNITRWNNLPNPDSIDVGQVLRVTPPPGSSVTASTRPRPADTGNGPTASAPDTPSAPSAPSAPTAPSPSAAPGIALIWPASGAVIRSFDGAGSKGIDIAGALGAPVVASAPGTVVYASNGLRGYGNLLIIKHGNDYLTAYAHNNVLLVKEGQTVTQGQKIAEMGSSDSNRVMLHFELRYAGRSIDPSSSLPPR